LTQLAERIRVDAEKRADPKRREDLHRYFKEPNEIYGLNQTQNKEIAKKFYPEVKGDFEAALELTEELMATGNMDLAPVGLRILDRFRLKLGA
jgi:3-methyladenine DNA glycosylase AlkD